MGFRTGLIIGAGIGYVLGAKAGRERYEQIVAAFNDMTDRPEVQDLVAKGRSLMDSAAQQARTT